MVRARMPDPVLRTNVGDVPLEEYQLALEGRTWRILHTGAIITHEDEQRFLGAERRLPYGIVLWPSSIALAHELATRAWSQKSVLEIGAGTGLPGVIAGSLGASVVQTDSQEVALAVAKMNAERNGVTIDRRVGDWTAWTDAKLYDVIIGSDILYGTTMHEHLRAIFEKNLAPGGRILVADPFRKQSFPLFEAMEVDGWKVSFNKWSVSVRDERPRSIGVFELTR
jgi:predicted nicotinamide N-methyase